MAEAESQLKDNSVPKEQKTKSRQVIYENKEDIKNSAFKILNSENKKIMEGTYKDGKTEGPLKIYNKKGILIIHFNYINNKKEGKYEMYNPQTGILFKTGLYKNDKLEGETIIYEEKGFIIAKENYKQGLLDGDRIYYYPTGENKVMKKRSYKEGRELSSITFYMSGGIMEEKELNEKGEVVRSIRYTDEGDVVESFVAETTVKKAI